MSNCRISFTEWKFVPSLTTYLKISKISLQTKKWHLREMRAFFNWKVAFFHSASRSKNTLPNPYFLGLTTRKCHFFVCKPILLILRYVVNDGINFYSVKEIRQLDHFWRNYFIYNLNFDISHCGPPMVHFLKSGKWNFKIKDFLDQFIDFHKSDG